MRKLIFWLISFVVVFSVMFSCCKTTDKGKDNPSVEENIVTEITGKNNNVQITSENLESLPSIDEQSVSGRINIIYKDMIQDMKKETSYAASYTVKNTSSLSFPWMDSLIDDGKYFYAIGWSKLCGGKDSASNFAETNAAQNLKKAAIKVSGDENVDVRLWEVFETCYKKVTTDKGRTYYTATVLIGIDRNLVVKN